MRVDDRRSGPGAGAGVRRAVRTVLDVAAFVVRLVGFVMAAVLVVRLALAFVPVNPGNVIVEWIGRLADTVVWGFRDLFLPVDPLIGLVANYGLAAVFWLVVGLVVAGVLSALGRRVAGRTG